MGIRKRCVSSKEDGQGKDKKVKVKPDYQGQLKPLSSRAMTSFKMNVEYNKLFSARKATQCCVRLTKSSPASRT